MNAEIAKQRISEVVRIDTITSSYGDFLATHVPLKKIQLQDKFDLNATAKKTYSEEEVFRKVVLNPRDEHQFVLVIGSSGAGKSHLIRWFDAKLERQVPESEVVLFVRRSDNTLKGTIKQLLEKPEVASIHNKDLYERLVNATSTISESKLRNAIYYQFIQEIVDDDGENVDYMNNADRKRLVPLLSNETFKQRMMAEDGPIERIYSKVSETTALDNRDVIAEFKPSDFEVDVNFCDKILNEGGDKKAIRLMDKLIVEPELAESIATYLNSMVDTVIQSCAGLEPGDFEQVFKEIRRELKKQGKSLTFLIEDITAFTGVNEALLNVLTTWHTGENEKDNMCRVSSIIGTTSEYFNSNFRDNYKARVTKFIVIPDDVFGASEDDLCEFVGRYLNAMSLPKSRVDDWANGEGLSGELPLHDVSEGKGWDTASTAEGKILNLYPFSRKAIVYLYNHMLQENYRTPRFLLRDVVEKTVRDALWNFDNFPGFKIDNVNINSGLRDAIAKTGVSQEKFERMYLFMCVWGNATAEVYKDSDVTYIAGLSEQVYTDLDFPLITGKTVTAKTVQEKPAEKKESGLVKSAAELEAEKRLEAAKKQLNESFQAVEAWVAGGTINVGSTTGNVAQISRAREEMCTYLYSAIDWQAEGVSMDNINKIKRVKEKLVGFERQKRGSDAMFYKLPANRETQAVIEAFMEWNVLGGESWNFPGAEKRIYKVQLWAEKLKKPLIKAITSFADRSIDYFECAMMTEFYRIILLGMSKTVTIDGLKAEHIIENDLKSVGANSHSNAWNQLASYIIRNETDKINRSTVIQYCNVIQGESGKQVFLDRESFDAMVKTVKSKKLRVDEDILEIQDPVKPRRDARDLLRNVLDKLEHVKEEELEKAEALMSVIRESFEIDDIDDEDVVELVDKVEFFYDTAQTGKLPLKYNQELFENVRKYSKSISQGVREIANAQNRTDTLECILAFSQDPIRKVERLVQLLNKVTTDIDKAQKEIEARKTKYGSTRKSAGDRYVFAEEEKSISQCMEMIERLEAASC